MPGLKGIEKIEVRRSEVEIDPKVEPFLQIPLEINGAAHAPSYSTKNEALQGFLAIGETGPSRRIALPIAVTALALLPNKAEARELQPSRSQNPEVPKDAGSGSGGSAIELGFAMIVGMAFMGRGKGKGPIKPEEKKESQEGPEDKTQVLEKVSPPGNLLQKISAELDAHDTPFLAITGIGGAAGLLTFLSVLSLPLWIPVTAFSFGFIPLLARRQRIQRVFERDYSQKPLSAELTGADRLDASGYEAARKFRAMASDSVLSAPERLDALEKLGKYLVKMHPDHPERARLLKYLLSMIRDPKLLSHSGMGLEDFVEKSFEQDWASRTLQWSQALRLTAMQGYLEVMRDPQNTPALIPGYVKALRQTLENPRWPLVGEVMVRWREGKQYLKVFDETFRLGLLKVYLGSLAYLPKDHPEILEAHRMVRKGWVLDLVQVSARMKLNLWGVLSLELSDKAEIQKTRRIFERKINF